MVGIGPMRKDLRSAVARRQAGRVAAAARLASKTASASVVPEGIPEKYRWPYVTVEHSGEFWRWRVVEHTAETRASTAEHEIDSLMSVRWATIRSDTARTRAGAIRTGRRELRTFLRAVERSRQNNDKPEEIR